MTEGQKNTGLAPVRTARLIASLFALMGMVFLLLERVLSAVLEMASGGVALGLARYNNFTGRFAAQNFSEDKELLGLLKEVEGLLPMADVALVVLLVIAVLLILVAAAGLAFPRQMVHILVATKLLKWQTGTEAEPEGASLGEALERLGNVPLKKIALPLACITAVVVVVFAVRSCNETAQENDLAASVRDMQEQSLAYINAQKGYFAKNGTVGNAKALQLVDSVSTDYFDYRITPSRFIAVSKVDISGCPAGSKWSVSASAKGVFTMELALYRSTPKDTNCVKLTPDYKNLGRAR